MTDLAIPEPSPTLTLARVEDLSAQIIRWAETAPPGALVVTLDKGLALERYLKKRGMAGPMQTADRHMERAIGIHLGEPVHGRPQKKRTTINLSENPETDKQLKIQFRLLAKWWAEIIGRLPLTRASALKIARARDRGQAATDGIEPPEIHHTSCRDLADRIGPESVDVIVTDPPYADLECYSELGETAATILVPGGQCWAMAGHTYLPEVIERLGHGGLGYYWTVAYLTPGGQSVQQWDRKVNIFWKPVLVYAKRGAPSRRWFGDVARSAVNDNDSDAHPEGWAQSETGIADLITRASEPGWVVCDPFVGTGTTALEATKLGRRFIGSDADADRVEQSRRRLGA